MAPPSTGHLELRGGVWHVRLSKGSGKERKRDWYSLNTADKRVAIRRKEKLLEQIAAGNTPQQAAESLPEAINFAEWVATWNVKRKAQKIASARDDEQRLRDYAMERLGGMQLGDIKASHIEDVLDDVVLAGKSEQTVKHVRNAISRALKAAWRKDLITENPALKVELPKVESTKLAPIVLTDTEFFMLIEYLNDRVDAADQWAADHGREPLRDASLELRMLCACSRILGGMRTSDVNRWDYQQIDLLHFDFVIIPRTKKKAAQKVLVPAEIRPILVDWWDRAGRPTSGPVFPVRRGSTTGSYKSKKVSYAARLRRECKRAGLKRRELYVNTALTRRLDFHGFRRAFVTATANDPETSMQKAMLASDHSDPRTHLGYMSGAVTIPQAAIPKLPTRDRPRLAPPIGQSSEDASEAARHRGFEPLAFGSGGRGSDHARTDPTTPDKASGNGPASVDHARSPAISADWPPMAPADGAAGHRRPRVHDAASERARQRLEHARAVALGEIASTDPEAEVRSLLEATCDDLGLAVPSVAVGGAR